MKNSSNPSDLPLDKNAEAEAHRRSLTLAWLAETSPIEAAPSDSLSRIRQELGLNETAHSRKNNRTWPFLAAAGWAAAAFVALLLWPREDTVNISETINHEEKPKNSAVNPDIETQRQRPIQGGTISPIENSAELRQRITVLRSQLRNETNVRPGVHRPVILELRPPGKSPRSGSREHILDIIATALENDLNRSADGDPGEVIIESGWAKWAKSEMPQDTIFRHRDFPVDRANELGLSTGPNGQFFDTSTGLLWTPDPETGDYTGRTAPAELDRTAFVESPPVIEKPSPMSSPVAEPSGYLVGDSDGQTIVAMTNLPAVRDDASVELVAYSASGVSTAFSVPTNIANSSSTWSFSGVIPNSVGNIVDFRVSSVNASGESQIIIETGSSEEPQ